MPEGDDGRHLEPARALLGVGAMAAVAEHLPCPVARLDGDLRLVGVNRAFAAWLDAEPDTLVGQPFADAVGVDNGERLVGLAERALGDGGHGGGVEALSFPARGTRRVRVDLSPAGDDLVVVLTDVEELVAREDELRQLNRSLSDRIRERTLASQANDEELFRLTALVEASDDAIVGLDADGVITHWNPAAQRLFGWRRDEALGQPVLSLLPAMAPDPLEPILERVRAGEVVTEDARRRRKDGQVVDASLTVAPLRDGGGRVKGMALVARDVAGRRRLEADLLQAQKMEAVGRLSSGIAHDFRNLLMAIGGCCDLVARNLHNPAVARQYLDEAKTSTERGARLTDQLLAFGRKKRVERQVAHVGEALSASENMLRRLIGEDVALRIRRDPSEPSVAADPSQLEQIVMNLVVNARDAMPNGGEIVLRTRPVLLGADGDDLPPDVDPGAFVELSVQDDGVGMSEATRTSVFEPFFTTKAIGEGTGLGLTTVYAAVQQMGGFIDVDSREGAGTTFRVCIPAAEGQRAPPPPPSPERPEAASQSATVLLTEDDPLVRLTVRHYLEVLGHRVLEAVDVKDAIAIADAEADAVDVLVTDMVMPSMSGRELARYLLARLPELRVVYISAHPLATLEAQGRLEPGMPVLQKPFGPNELQAALEAALADR